MSKYNKGENPKKQAAAYCKKHKNGKSSFTKYSEFIEVEISEEDVRKGFLESVEEVCKYFGW
jgi:hypothetical protein